MMMSCIGGHGIDDAVFVSIAFGESLSHCTQVSFAILLLAIHGAAPEPSTVKCVPVRALLSLSTVTPNIIRTGGGLR